MFFPTRFGQSASNSDLANKYSGAINGLTERGADIYIKAREGRLDFSEVLTSDDACRAQEGYESRLHDKSLPAKERSFAYQFLENLECDFGEGPVDAWSAVDQQEKW